MANTRRAPVGDLFYRYVYTMRDLNVGNSEHVVVLHDEERKFFEIAKDANDLNDETLANDKLNELRRYTVELAKGIVDGYISLFTGKWDELSPETNDTWKSLENSIPNGEILQDYTYNGLYLICQSLLFLLRTTRRAMFIYITAGGASEHDTKSNVKNSMETVYKYIREFLRNIDNNEKEFIQTISQLEETSLELSQLSQANQNALEAYKQKEVDYKKRLSNCAKEVETYRNKEEAEKLRKAKEETNVAALEAKRRREEEQERRAEEERIEKEKNSINNEKNKQELNENLEKIARLSNKFITMFARFVAKYKSETPETVSVLDKDRKQLLSDSLTCTAEKTNDTVNSIISTLNVYKNRLNDKELTEGFKIASRLLTETNVIEERNMTNSVFIDYIPMLNILWRLSNIQAKYTNIINIESNVYNDLKQLYPSNIFYTKLFLLYEDMSGAVRVIVRMRDMNVVKTGGSQRKRRVLQESDKLRKRRRINYIGGGDGDLSPDYDIILDENNNNVRFKNITSISNYYTDTDTDTDKDAFIFGPFHGVHNGNDTEDDVIKKSLDFEGMKTVLLKGENIVLYTYGYSGSGKTYTLFGSKGSTEKGLVWNIIRRLEKSDINVQLAERKQCYGILTGSDDNTYMFKDGIDTKKAIEIEGSTDTKCKEWVKVIKDDIHDNLTDVKSFIKKTANNDESSRGFYILEFKLKYNGRPIGSLGVVDMAGNEDPFDIASAMCPSLDFENMSELVSNPNNITGYDFVFQELSRQLCLILSPKIMNCLATNFLNYKTNVVDQYIENNMKQSKFLGKPGTEYIKGLTTLEEAVKKTKEEKADKALHYYVKDVNKDSVIHLTVTKNPAVAEANVTIKTSFFKNVINIVRLEYEDKIGMEKVQYYKDISRNENGIDAVKKLLIRASKSKTVHEVPTSNSVLSDDEKFKVKLLQMIEKNIENSEFNCELKLTFKKILIQPDKIYEMANIVNEKVNTGLNEFLKTQKYFIPMDGRNLEASYLLYERIAQIIREGYYINKANAELMKFFTDKRNFVVHDDKDFDKKDYRYTFDGFNFKDYDKFKSLFTPCNLSEKLKRKASNDKGLLDESLKRKLSGINCVDSTLDVGHFDTNLVKTIVNMFGKNAKDIMFTCIRNDKDLGKALGAIDTLLLVKELKST